jgi:tetratricopeptide (TPR) repeat protein
VWGKSYTALVGLYFTETSPAVNNAFLNVLGDAPIGERLGKTVDRNAQLAGDVWFYYGSRYGEYLGDTKQGAPEDYLPAVLEQSPASSSGYQTLADYYAESGDTRSAIADYKHALELSPGHADIHERLALAYYKDGKRAEAIAEWKLVFSILLKQVNSARVPESFWSDFSRACNDLHSRRLFGAVKPEVDGVVRAYLGRNGNYRSNAILRSGYTAIGDPVAATTWLLDVSSSSPASISVLADVVDAEWIPLAQRGPIYQRILEGNQKELARTEGLERENAQSGLRSWQIRWIRYLIETKQFRPAGDSIVALQRDSQSLDASALVPFELRIAAQAGTLDENISGYRADPENAPSAETLRAAARQIFESGDKQSARKILEFVFARDLDEHKLVAANFLGLAEIRIAAGDTPGAVELLKRLVAAVGDLYQNMDSAAALLEKTGHNVEAVGFLAPLVNSTPWEPAYRLRLAKAQISAKTDANIARDGLARIATASQNPYDYRVDAALVLSGSRQTADFGSAELKLLAGDPKSITLTAADHPFFYDARVKAAQNSSDAHQKAQILAKALEDTPARDDARIPLFHAAVAVHSDEFAMGSIEQMLRDQRFRQVASNDTNNEEEILSSDQSPEEQDEESSPLYGPTKLPPAQQAQLAQAVGLIFVRLQRFSEALGYLQAARTLEKNPARRKVLVGEISDVKARLRRQQLNAARQPILHAELEQDRLVRPRLVAHATPSAKPAATSGEGQ